jgi:hypothetical protein
MTTVTHPYGTTRKATVLKSDLQPSAMLLVDELGEGHILMYGCGDMKAEAGDTGTLTFTKGGPAGGYWKFRKDA